MNDEISPREFDDYVGLLSKLLKLRTSQREAISDELRLHLEERFAALTEQGVAPQKAISLALAEFGDAAALAAQFSSVARLQKRRWMMRFVFTSTVTIVVAVAVGISMWPDGSGNAGTAMAQTQQAARKTVKPLKDAEMVANAKTMAKLEQIGKVNFDDQTLTEVAEFFSKVGDLQVLLNMRALQEDGIEPDLPIAFRMSNVPIKVLLRRMLAEYELAYTLDHGVVIITTQDNAECQMIIRVYRVDDLVRSGKRAVAGKPRPSVVDKNAAGTPGSASPGRVIAKPLKSTGNADMDALIKLITSTVNYNTWQTVGGEGVISQYRGALVITQTMTVQMKVEKLLNELRQAISDDDELAMP